MTNRKEQRSIFPLLSATSITPSWVIAS